MWYLYSDFFFFVSVVVSICFCSSVSIAQAEGKFSMVTYAACSVSGVCLLVLCYSLSRQPQSTNRPTFHVIIYNYLLVYYFIVFDSWLSCTMTYGDEGGFYNIILSGMVIVSFTTDNIMKSMHWNYLGLDTYPCISTV